MSRRCNTRMTFSVMKESCTCHRARKLLHAAEGVPMIAMRRILPLLAGVAVSSPALAADAQAWQTVAANVTLAPALKVQAELVVRESEPKGLYEIEQTTLLAYKTGQVTVAAGYVH